MYCKNCGKVISEDARFCMYCGTPVEIIPAAVQTPVVEPETEPAPVAPVVTETVEPEVSIKRERPVFEEINWNVSEYPDNNEVVEKTEDIDFNWNANPADIPEPIAKRELNDKKSQATAEPMSIEAQTIDMINGSNLESELFGEMNSQPEDLSAAERIDKFYTFNKKNEEFQALLNREYSKVKSGNVIGSEMSMADEIAAELFETRSNRPKTMEDFLEEEGVVKPYQPKAFESDVLQRIEAQEAAREAKRREDEARAKAIEEARREAEAAKLAEIEAARKAAEEAKAKAEAEAREAARMVEEARIKAEEEAKARAEELARREAEEAKIRAEEEARRIAEEEARIKAEAVARYQAAEEARIRAEEELKAAQEAAKIKAQQEARKAAEAQARFEAEQEKRRLAEQEAQSILEAKRSKLEREANETIAAEEARKVLEQTARMRDEESAKIRAAVASLRSGAGLGSSRASAISKEAEEAHRATQAQISEMAKARNTFLGDFNLAEELEKEPASEPVAEPPVEETPDLAEFIFGKSEPIREREPEIEKVQITNNEIEVTSRETMLNTDLSATRVVDKSAILAGISDNTIKASKTKFAGMAAPTPAPKNERRYDDIDDLLSQLESVENDVDEELAKGGFKNFEQVEPEAEPVEEPVIEEAPVNDIKDVLDELSEFDELMAPTAEVEEPTMLFTPAAGEPAVENKKDDLSGTKRFDIDVPVGESSGDTIVIGQPQTFADLPSNDFDDYGNEEAARLIEEQTNSAEPEIPQAVVEEKTEVESKPVKEKKPAAMSKKEKKAAEKAAKAEAKAAKAAAKAEAKAEGGKGSIVLKIVLVILCIVLIAEVAGIAVHFIAPQSKAAEIVDTQLNMLIHKFTGEEDTQYNVFAEQRRTEALDDKTTLIEAKADMNYKNSIGSIVWNQDLKYTDADGEEVMDLVLSMPITDVEWGRDENNGSVYYDEQVVGEVIAYESARYAYINDSDEKVMEYIDQTSGLNATLQEKKGTGSGTFERLEIGEIRTSGSSYYAWVNEVMSDQTVRKVLKMIPGDGYSMQMVMAYTME